MKAIRQLSYPFITLLVLLPLLVTSSPFVSPLDSSASASFGASATISQPFLTSSPFPSSSFTSSSSSACPTNTANGGRELDLEGVSDIFNDVLCEGGL
ncbi:hypothetical protein BJ165DRAFT_934143 [Panaeolus papilionaceus]|nr:hypothetical protein BJ165DRAFT_934143 [Panaeolus papilionaceus]